VPASVAHSLLIGVDLGPNFSLTGSLATILWLIALRREGEDITPWRFLRLGVLVTVPALVLAPPLLRGERAMPRKSSLSSDRTKFRPISLDALNFLLADVRRALGPFLNVFLVTQQHWSQSSVGLMTTISGLVGLAAQIPAGAAIDATRAKRGVVVIALPYSP